MKFLLAILFVLLALTSYTEACAKKCKHLTSSDFPGCNLQIEACGCVSWNMKVTYIVKICDPVSRACADSDYQKDKDYAGQLATFNLFANSNNRGCNCRAQPVPLGSCVLASQICAYFPSVGAVAAKQPALRVYLRDANVEIAVEGFPPTEAAAGIVTAMRSLNTRVNLSQKCGAPVPSADEIPQSLLALTADIPQMSANAEPLQEFELTQDETREAAQQARTQPQQ